MTESNKPKTPFDPAPHVRQLRGGRGGGGDYLDVKWRLVWLRDRHPTASVETVLMEHIVGQHALFRAMVTIPHRMDDDDDRDDDHQTIGHGMETQADFPDYLEKAETKAIGRALAHAGFGTQFVADDDDRIADAPVARDTAHAPVKTAVHPEDPATPSQLAAIKRLWQNAYGDADIGPRLAADFQVTSTDDLVAGHAAKLITALDKEWSLAQRARAAVAATGGTK